MSKKIRNLGSTPSGKGALEVDSVVLVAALLDSSTECEVEALSCVARSLFVSAELVAVVELPAELSSVGLEVLWVVLPVAVLCDDAPCVTEVVGVALALAPAEWMAEDAVVEVSLGSVGCAVEDGESSVATDGEFSSGEHAYVAVNSDAKAPIMRQWLDFIRVRWRETYTGLTGEKSRAQARTKLPWRQWRIASAFGVNMACGAASLALANADDTHANS